MTDLERRIAAAAPTWPEPSAGVERRTREALGWDTTDATPAGRPWWRRRRGAGRLLLAGAVLVVGGAVATAAIITTSGGAATGNAASLDFGVAEVVGMPVSANEGQPRVVVDGVGNVTVVWGRGGRVTTRTRNATGVWGAERTISPRDQHAGFADAAIDADGNLVVVWRQRTTERHVEEHFTLPSGAPAGRFSANVDRRWAPAARVRTPDGAWGTTVLLAEASPTVRDMAEPQVGIAADGTMIALWNKGAAVWSRERHPGAEAWTDPAQVGSGRGPAVRAHLAVAASGHAVVAWANRPGWAASPRIDHTVSVALRQPTGEWGPTHIVASNPGNPRYLDTAVNSAGEAVVAFTTSQPRGDIVNVARGSASGEWAEPEAATATNAAFYAGPKLDVALEGGGRALIFAPGSSPPAASSVPGASWLPLPLLRDGHFVRGHYAITSNGEAVLAWGGSALGTIVQRPGEPDGAHLGRNPIPRDVAVGVDGTTAVVWSKSASGDEPSRVVVAIAKGQAP